MLGQRGLWSDWRSVRRALVAAFVLLALTLVLDVAGSAKAATIAPSTGSSCVATIEGLTSSNTITANATPRAIRFKCYYDPTADRYLDGTYSRPGGGCINVALPTADGTSAGAYPCPGSSGYNMQYLTPVVTLSAYGYVEFSTSVSCPTSCTSSASHYRQFTTSRWAGMRFSGGTVTGSSATSFWMGMSQTGSTAHRDPLTGHYVPESDFAAASPPYRWAAEYGAPACEQLRMFIANPGRTIAPGATINATFTEGWPAVMDSDSVLLRYRWSPTDPWVTWYNAATAGGLIPSTQTFTNSTGGPRTGVTLEVHCAGDGGSYLRGDNSPGGVTPQQPRPCDVLTLGWPDEGNYSGGEPVWLDINVGTTDPDSIVGLLVGGGRFGNEQTDVVASVIDVDSITWLAPGGVTESFPIGSGSFKGSFMFDLDWTTDDGLYVKCEDAAGFRTLQYIAPSGVGKLPVPETYGNRLDLCLDGVNFGIRPSSWLPSFFKTSACFAQVMFVPLDDDVSGFLDDWDALAAKAPISFVVEVGTALMSTFSDTPSQLAAHRNDCLEVLDAEDEVGESADVSVCPSTLSSPTLTTVRGFLAGAVYLGTGLGLYTATRKLISP